MERIYHTSDIGIYIATYDFWEEHYPTTPYIHIFECTYICVDICIHVKLIKYYIFMWLLPKSLVLVILPLTPSVLWLFPEATCCQIKCPVSLVESFSQVEGQRCPRNFPNSASYWHCSWFPTITWWYNSIAEDTAHIGQRFAEIKLKVARKLPFCPILLWISITWKQLAGFFVSKSFVMYESVVHVGRLSTSTSFGLLYTYPSNISTLTSLIGKHKWSVKSS